LIDIVKEMKVHSPEESKTDLENLTKRKIIVYDYNWRSDKVLNITMPNIYMPKNYLLMSNIIYNIVD